VARPDGTADELASVLSRLEPCAVRANDCARWLTWLPAVAIINLFGVGPMLAMGL